MRARSCFVLLMIASCGPIYPTPTAGSQPAQPQQPQQPTTQIGPPGGGDPEPRGGGDLVPAERVEPGRPSEPVRQAEPTRPAPPTSTAPAGIPAAFVAAHNAMRAKHCATPLAWSPQLANAAQAWAQSLKAQGCRFGHKPNNPFGENLAAGTSGTLDAESVVGMWYDEVKLYQFPNGGFSMQTGHFTQVVWRETTKVGCGTVTCNGLDIWVCEYDPPGNVETMYRQNVLPAGCR